MLAEMGAEVIKVESAPHGDMVRNASTFRNKRSLYYVQHNRGKKSLCVNLRDPLEGLVQSLGQRRAGQPPGLCD
jgi:crotonobetainyl-CoA:carnitine CoA-transferase CaiB-like acyl-CoA transferase